MCIRENLYFFTLPFRCYTMYDRCDGQYQCDDGSDEHGCTVSDCSFPFPRKYCPMDRLCVPKDTDCPSLQDFACPNQKPMRCKDYSGCYSSDQVCDGVSDCSDNTDEYCQIPTIETPITSDLTRSVTTLLGILGCIPIFAIFVFLHKYCENKIMTYKPRVLQTTSNMPTMQNRSRSTAHSSGVDPAVQEPIAVRPLLRPPAICRPVSIHTNMSTVPVHHTSAPQYSQIVPSDTSYSLGAPPPYSLCAARSAPIFMDMPPSYEEAIAQSTVRVQQQTSCDSEGSLLIRLHF